MSQRRTAVKVCIGAAVAGVLAWGGTTFLNRETTSRAIRDAAAAEPLSCEPWMNNNLEEFFAAVLVADDVSRCLKAGADIEARDEDGATPLHMAAGFKSSAAVKALLDAGADIEARADYGLTPLHMAASSVKINKINSYDDYLNNAALVGLLLDASADIEARTGDGWTPLHMAAKLGRSPAVVKALLDAGADLEAHNNQGEPPLYVAAEDIDLPVQAAVVRALLDAGADIQQVVESDPNSNGLVLAILGGHHLEAAYFGHRLTYESVVCQRVWNDSRYFTLLAVADVTRCLEAGADTEADKYGETRLHMAAAWGSPAVVKVLLDAGADLEARAEGGATPLHMAAEWSQSPAVVKALLDAGADLEARAEGGATPLHMAAEWSQSPAVVKALLDAGADLEARNEDGEIPLHRAAVRGYSPAVVGVLLDAGTDLEARNEDGETPARVGSRSVYYAMKRLFKGLASN